MDRELLDVGRLTPTPKRTPAPETGGVRTAFGRELWAKILSTFAFIFIFSASSISAIAVIESTLTLEPMILILSAYEITSWIRPSSALFTERQ